MSLARVLVPSAHIYGIPTKMPATVIVSRDKVVVKKTQSQEFWCEVMKTSLPLSPIHTTVRPGQNVQAPVWKVKNINTSMWFEHWSLKCP